jgi:vancomycin permeability regulator SanA
MALLVVGANVRLWVVSSGHRFDPAAAPTVPVVIVPGAKVGPDGAPMAYLRGRLDVAIELLRAGRAREILASGDAAGTSGDEIASMTRYLAEHGIDPALVRPDGARLSTWETCERAARLFDIDRAIIVTRYRYVPRAVPCRRNRCRWRHRMQRSATRPNRSSSPATQAARSSSIDTTKGVTAHCN